MSRRDYSEREIEAAHRILAELFDLLEEYRDGIVLIGGWVPFFAIPDPETPHEGTKDVDLALNPSALRRDGDQTIEEILMQGLYRQDTTYPLRWHKVVTIDGEDVSVIVDFVTGEHSGYRTGQLQTIQDIRVSTLRGCDAAFLQPVEVPIPTFDPDRRRPGTFQMASLPQFLVMKGLAFHNRDQLAQTDPTLAADARKDAYDIYFIVKNYPSGWRGLADLIRPHLGDPLLQESLTKLAAKWNSIGAMCDTIFPLASEGSLRPHCIYVVEHCRVLNKPVVVLRNALDEQFLDFEEEIKSSVVQDVSFFGLDVRGRCSLEDYTPAPDWKPWNQALHALLYLVVFQKCC